MRKVINCLFMGRFGNTMFQMAHALAYAEKWNCELRTDPWPGFRIFTLDYNPIGGELPRRSDHDLINGETNVSLRGYFQNARSAIYNQEQIRRWFRFRPHVEAALQEFVPARDAIVAHQRVGDYIGYSYPVLDARSYPLCCEKHGLDAGKIRFVTEEQPATHPQFTDELAFVPDFFRLAKAKTLLRGNSSFSFWAGAIGETHGARVFSPVIDGLKGGEFHVVSNWLPNNSARIADFDFVDSIRIPT